MFIYIEIPPMTELLYQEIRKISTCSSEDSIISNFLKNVKNESFNVVVGGRRD